MSAGNHAQGISLGCKYLGIKATIVMPNNTPFEKIRKNIDYGANVIIHGNNVLESEKHVNKLVEKYDFVKIHPSLNTLLHLYVCYTLYLLLYSNERTI